MHRAKKDKRTEWITATINGDVVSWTKVYYGPTAAAPAPDVAPTVPAAAPPAANVNYNAEPDTNGSSSGSGSAPQPKPASSGKDWDRTSYYNAETQEAENLVFVGNYGGQFSGVFDT